MRKFVGRGREHASSLNQIEIYFSVIQRKLLTPDDFPNLDVLANQLRQRADVLA